MFSFCVPLGVFGLDVSKPVHFTNRNNLLSGHLVSSTDSGKKLPAVIFLPGSSNSSYQTIYADFVKFFLEKRLVQKGLAILYFNKTGIGKSSGRWYTDVFSHRAKPIHLN